MTGPDAAAPESQAADDDLRRFLGGATANVISGVERYDDTGDRHGLIQASPVVFMLLEMRQGLIDAWRSSVCGTTAVWFRAASDAWARPEFLTTAIDLGREALSLPAPDDPERLAHQHNLARALVRAFEYHGDPDLLEEAFDIMAGVIARLTPENPDRLDILSAWGSTLCQIHVQRHSEDAIRTGVEYLRTAVNETPEGDDGLPSRRNNLGNALRRLAELTSEIVHLDDAIENYRAGLAAHPRPAIAASLNNGLATALHDRFERALTDGSLEEAIECQREAVRLGPADDARTLGRRNNLSGYLIELYDRTGDPAVLSEALGILNELEVISSGRLERPAVLQSLANALHRASSRGLDLANGDEKALEAVRLQLDRARHLRREVLGLLPPGSPHYPGVQADLAKTLLRLNELYPDPAHEAEARSLLEAAFGPGSAVNPARAVDAGRGLVNLLESTAPLAAAEFGERALLLARQVALAQVGQHDRRLFLREISELPERTAMAWVAAGDIRRAVTALELGRAILLGDATALAERAASASGEDADLILRLRRDLASFAVLPVGRRLEAVAAVHSLASDSDVGARMATKPSWDTVAAAARIRPLLYLAPGHSTGLAILVVDGSSVPAVHKLPLMTIERVRDAVAQYLTALAYFREDPPNAAGAERSLAAVSALMDAMLTPELHDALSVLRDIAVVPSGELSFLPFQLLGASDPAGPLLARGVSVTSCPSAAALAWSARMRGDSQLTPRLVIAVTRGKDAAPAASLEASVATSHSGETIELFDEEATVSNVLRQLGECGFLHVISHGLSDPWNASESKLSLFDGPLSAEELFTASLGRGRLALLTSCESAISELELPDETSGLPLSLLHAGFGAVIGTSWPVPGTVAARFAALFYKRLLHGENSPADAYRLATTELRKSTAEDIVRWAEASSGHQSDDEARILLRLRGRNSGSTAWEHDAARLPLFCWGAFRYLGW